MKTTLVVPDELMRAVKIRSAEEKRELPEMVAILLARGLSLRPEGAVSRRVQFPLIQCMRRAAPEQEMTPDRVAEILLAEETCGQSDSLR